MLKKSVQNKNSQKIYGDQPFLTQKKLKKKIPTMETDIETMSPGTAALPPFINQNKDRNYDYSNLLNKSIDESSNISRQIVTLEPNNNP